MNWGWVHLKLSLAGGDTSQGSQSATADVLTAHSLESKATILNAPLGIVNGFLFIVSIHVMTVYENPAGGALFFQISIYSIDHTSALDF